MSRRPEPKPVRSRLELALAAGMARKQQQDTSVTLAQTPTPPSVDMYLDKTLSDPLEKAFKTQFASDLIYDREHSTLTLREWADAMNNNLIIDIGSYGLFQSTNLPSYDGNPAINNVTFEGYVDKRTIDLFALTGVVKSLKVMRGPYDGLYGQKYVRTLSDAPLLPEGQKKSKVSYSGYTLHDISKILEETYDPVKKNVIFLREGGIFNGGVMPNNLVALLGPAL